MGLRLEGKIAASAMKEQLKLQFDSLDRKAKLAIIHYNDPANASYLKGRLKIAYELNVEVEVIEINDNYKTQQVIDIINNLNSDRKIDGIMVDRPLPKTFDENAIISSISSQKDVDGYTSTNLGKLLANQDCFVPATPKAAVKILEYYDIDLNGKDVLVIGRSVNVGKPLALLLLNKNATVTVAHSKTVNLKEKCKQADFIFLALGKANFLLPNDISENTIIVDIGINFDENGKLCGDASKDCYDIAKAYTPVPGGVGVMTNVILMENLLKAYKSNNE